MGIPVRQSRAPPPFRIRTKALHLQGQNHAIFGTVFEKMLKAFFEGKQKGSQRNADCLVRRWGIHLQDTL